MNRNLQRLGPTVGIVGAHRGVGPQNYNYEMAERVSEALADMDISILRVSETGIGEAASEGLLESQTQCPPRQQDVYGPGLF